MLNTKTNVCSNTYYCNFNGYNINKNKPLNKEEQLYYKLQKPSQEIFVKQEAIKDAREKEKKIKKRKLNSIGLTLLTVAGLATLGNCSSNKMAKLGQQVDDILMNTNWYKKFEASGKNLKNKVKNYIFQNKNTFIKDSANDIAETLKTKHAQPKVDIARGYGRGFTSIFSLTPGDIIKTSITKLNKKNPGQGLKSIEKLVGKADAQQFYDQIMNINGIKDTKIFCDNLTNAIAKNYKLTNAAGETDKKKLLDFLLEIQKGKAKGVDFSEFTQVKMNNDNGITKVISNWWPVNLIDDLGQKVVGKNWKGFCRGNLGDSLVKYNSVNGSLANTFAGKLIQNSLTIPTESISNFVNDKSGLGVLLSLMIVNLYNNAQEAPKEQRAGTIANDYVNTIGSIAFVTPAAYGTMYGLASLKNLEGKTSLTKGLKQLGKLFGVGHDTLGKNGKIIKEVTKKGMSNKLQRYSGHALRFFLTMFVFSSLFSKPLNNVVNKIFGEPYDKDAEAAKLTKAENEKKIKIQQELIRQQILQNHALQQANNNNTAQPNYLNNSMHI